MLYIESDFTDALCDCIDSGSWTKKNYVESFNCLLDSVFVPDMTDRMQEKTMQQRLRDEEPDVFDSYGPYDQMEDLGYIYF